MNALLARCPACQAECPPQAAICDTCGRVLADAARTTLPLLAAQPVAAARPAAPAQPLAMLPAALLVAGQGLAQGRYTIQRPLSQGGMGAIYLATDHEAFGRTVVIKALLGDAEASTPEEMYAAASHAATCTRWRPGSTT